ncbi:hypothetical protein DFQ30_005067 [Apophysomyces sp. BC1015]|nr:hypothetical protein DFQ30_005067 [Apophysomyces sp. BC1015]
MGASPTSQPLERQMERNQLHPAQSAQEDIVGDAEQGQSKHPRRRRRGSRRRSSCATIEINAATERSQSSTAPNDGSAALQSLQDIIAEMKRLPTNSVRRISHSGEEILRGWEPTQLRNRRHSEPPQQLSSMYANSQHQDSEKANEENQIIENGDIYLHLPQPLISRPLTLEESLLEEPLLEEPLLEEPQIPPHVSNGQGNFQRLARRHSVPANHNRQQQQKQHQQNSSSQSQPVVTARKPLYPSHLSLPEATKLLKACKAFSGVLQVDRQDSSDAFVDCDELGEIYVYGSRNRNRALDGDTVAVELVDVDDMLAEKSNKKQARTSARRQSVPHLSTSVPPLSSIPEGSMPTKRPAYCGKVICILERPRHALFSGTLSLFRPNAHRENDLHKDKKQSHPKIIWFVPADKRLPLVAVPIKHAPSGFVRYHEEFKHRIFIGNIQRWPASSLHPFGTIENEIGYMGELNVHSRALIADHHLKEADFSDHVTRSAASVSDHEESKHRRQQPHALIYAIGESETDHAFSIQTVENDDVYELGIHVPDIAHFIHLNTHVDREARERAFAIELVEKKIPMLPQPFVKSRGLMVGQERLAFSVLCRVTKSGAVLHTWIGKTLVSVSKALSFAEAGNSNDQGLKSLLAVCCVLQSHRINDGGLSLTKPCQHFQLGENGYPEALTHTNQADSDVSVLLQEPLILANKEVGQKISSRFPDHALLCRQEEPSMTSLELLRDYFDSGEDIFGLLEAAKQVAVDEKRETLQHLLRKIIPPAKYFCAGSLDIAKYRHFSSGCPLYTIFTEPLHNYASIVVQRQLDAALKGESLHMSSDTVDKIARHCNAKQAAREAAYQSNIQLYIAAHVYRQVLSTSMAVTQQAIVTCIKPTALVLYLPEYLVELSVSVPNMVTTEDGAEMVWKKKPRQETVVVTQKDEELLLHVDTQKEQHDEQETRQKVSFLSRIDVLVKADIKTSRPALEIELMNILDV